MVWSPPPEDNDSQAKGWQPPVEDQDAQAESHPIKEALGNIGQAWNQAKENPAYSTSPQGLLESGYDLANKAASKVGDIFEKETTQDPNNQINPTLANVMNKAISAGPALATLGIPTGASEGASQGLENFAGRKAIQSLEMPGIGELAPEERQSLAKFIQDNNLVGTDKADILEQARGLSKKFGSKIGEIANATEGEGLHVDPNEHFNQFDKLMSKADEFKGSANREAKSLARDYTAGASDIINKLPDNPSWSDIQKLKDQYGKLAFKSTGEIKSEGAKDTYFALKDMLTHIAEKAQDSNLAPEYKEALAGYSKIQPIESSLEKAVSSDFRGGPGMGVRGMIGLIRKLPGPVRAVAGPIAAATGHPYVGMAAALPELTNPALQSKAATLASKALPAGEQALRDYLTKHFQGQ